MIFLKILLLTLKGQYAAIVVVRCDYYPRQKRVMVIFPAVFYHFGNAEFCVCLPSSMYTKFLG